LLFSVVYKPYSAFGLYTAVKHYLIASNIHDIQSKSMLQSKYGRMIFVGIHFVIKKKLRAQTSVAS